MHLKFEVTRHTSHVTRHTSHVTLVLGFLCDFGLSASRESAHIRKQKWCVLNALHFVGILSIPHSSHQHRNTYFLCTRALSQKGGSGPLKVRAASAHNDSQPACSAHLISFVRFSVQSDIYAFGMFLYEVMTFVSACCKRQIVGDAFYSYDASFSV